MPADTVKPYPFRSAKVDQMQPKSEEGYMRYFTELGDDARSTDKTELLMTYLLAGIESKQGAIGPIVRVEFFWSHSPDNWRGAILFDHKGQAVFHAIHALLGYSGSGPALSQHILRCLGVPNELFEEANNEVPHQDYLVVFSREARMTYEGVEISAPFGDPGEWEWWRVR